MRSAKELLADEIVAAVAGLAPEERLAAIELAHRKVAAAVGKTPIAQPGKLRPFLDDIRRLMADPTLAILRFQIRSPDGGQWGTVVFVTRISIDTGQREGWAANFYPEDARTALKRLNREVMVPLNAPGLKWSEMRLIERQQTTTSATPS
ncbi:MAG: hypothetical protein ACTHOP_23855 [Mesorhizobium sp.]